MERFFFMKSSGQFSIVHCPAKMRDSNQTGDFVLSAIKPVGNQECWNDEIMVNIVASYQVPSTRNKVQG